MGERERVLTQYSNMANIQIEHCKKLGLRKGGEENEHTKKNADYVNIKEWGEHGLTCQNASLYMFWNFECICVHVFCSLARSICICMREWSNECFYSKNKKKTTRWLLLLSNSVLEPQCRTHKYIDENKTIFTRMWFSKYVCVCMFPLCVIRIKSKRRKKKKTTKRHPNDGMQCILLSNIHIVHCAFSYSAQKHCWLKTFSHRGSYTQCVLHTYTYVWVSAVKDVVIIIASERDRAKNAA